MNINNVLSRLDKEPKVLYDIGVGQRPHNEAEQFKKKYPKIEVFGTEPQLDVFLDRVTDYCGKIYPWGLWKYPCLLRLNKTACKGNSSVLGPTERFAKHINITEQEWISCVTLNDFDRACGGKKDEIFLWMDIEGAEYSALCGGIDLLKSGRVRWIYLEVSNERRRSGEPTARHLDSLLANLNYELHWKYDECVGHHNRLYRRV